MRAGYAFAEGAFLHGAAPEYHWVAESKRAWLWGVFYTFSNRNFGLTEARMGYIIAAGLPFTMVEVKLKKPTSL